MRPEWARSQKSKISKKPRPSRPYALRLKAESSAILSDRNSVGVRDGKLFPPHAYASYVDTVAAEPCPLFRVLRYRTTSFPIYLSEATRKPFALS